MNLIFWLGLLFGLPIGIVGSIIANRLDPSVSKILGKSSSNLQERSRQRLLKKYDYIKYLRTTEFAVSYVISNCILRALFCTAYVGFCVIAFVVTALYVGISTPLLQDPVIRYGLYVVGIIGAIGMSANMISLLRSTNDLAKVANFVSYEAKIVALTGTQPKSSAQKSP